MEERRTLLRTMGWWYFVFILGKKMKKLILLGILIGVVALSGCVNQGILTCNSDADCEDGWCQYIPQVGGICRPHKWTCPSKGYELCCNPDGSVIPIEICDSICPHGCDPDKPPEPRYECINNLCYADGEILTSCNNLMYIPTCRNTEDCIKCASD